jgi:hypothetical protein
VLAMKEAWLGARASCASKGEMSGAWRSYAGPLIVALILSICGCAHTAAEVVEEAAEEGTPAAIESSLIAMNKAENQERLRRLLASPALRQASYEFSRSVSDGALAAMTSEERHEQLQKISKTYIATVMAAAQENIDTQVSPAISRMLTRSVAAAVTEATSSESTQRIERLAASVATSTAKAMSQQLALSIREDMGPEMGRAAREMSRQTLLGAFDALGELDKSKNADAPILKRLNKALSQGENLAMYFVAGLGLLVVGLGLILWRTIVVAKRREAEAIRREAAMLTLAEALGSSDTKSVKPEILQNIREALGRGPQRPSAA